MTEEFLKILVVIPARGGSKGVPRKNIRDLNGKPLIAYAIEAALSVRERLHRVVVSTDDAEIAAIAKEYGADVPFMRPAELATDTAASLPVVQHALSEVEKMDGVRIDWTILVQPTSPFILGEDIARAIDLAGHAGATSVVSVREAMEAHPLLLKVIEGGRLRPYIEGAPEAVRRQDLSPPVYRRNGCIYMTRRDVLMEEGDLYGDTIIPYIMPPERSLDIDTEMDLKLASIMMKERG